MKCVHYYFLAVRDNIRLGAGPLCYPLTMPLKSIKFGLFLKHLFLQKVFKLLRPGLHLVYTHRRKVE